MDVLKELFLISSKELVREARFDLIFEFAELVHIELNDVGCTWRMKLSYFLWRK